MFSDERKLINGLINSDDNTFDYLLDLYGDDILRFCYIKTGELETAQDLTQETFINIYKYIKKFKGKSSLKTWIYKIALNCCREYFRKHKSTYSIEDIAYSDVKDDFDLEETILDILDNEMIIDSLSKIKDDYRDIIYMFYYKEFTIKDIAKILEEKENTVKTKLRRGRSQLGQVLKEAGIWIS